MNNKVFTIISVILIALLVLFLGVGVVFWSAFGGFAIFSQNPPKPEIKYGEFPFRLKYEINGQVIEVKDTLICEFNGFGLNEAGGKYRQWKSHLASGNKRITLLKDDDFEIFFTPGINNWEIAAVYMGDNEVYHNDINSTFPNAFYTKDFEDKRENAYIISADNLWKRYKIKLISWEPSRPIKNSFK